MENKMYAKPMYKCGVCETIFDNLRDRANCECACLKRQEEEAKKAAELKKQEEQKARHAEVTKLIDDACMALSRYMEDYGEYEYDGKLVNELEMSRSMEDDLLKMLHYFMF
jgi:hypothetical protein